MHSQSHYKLLRAETSEEERRNHILRVRCGEITSTGKPVKSERRKAKTRYGTKALNDFAIVGQTVSTHMRLPHLCHGITLHKRSSTTEKTERTSDAVEVVGYGKSVDDFHFGRKYPSHLKHLQEESREENASKPTMLPIRSIEVRIPQTAPMERADRPHRRWSDGGSSFSGTLSDSFRPFNKTLARSLSLNSRSLNIVKSDPCVTQSPEEILNDFKEFSKKRDLINDDASVHSVRVLRALGTPRKDEHQRFLKKTATQVSTRENNQKVKRQRRRTSKAPLQKQKRRGLMVPSGDSQRSKNATQDKLYNTGTISTLSFRRGSRIGSTNRDTSIIRKYEGNDKRKGMLTGTEPPAVPSADEIQEIQEVPVIRRFLRMPKSRPKVVCFDYPGVDLTHMDVKKAVEKIVPDAFESGKVESIQFENINVKLATGGLDNRWLIELRDFTTRNKLIKSGLTIERPDRNSITDIKLTVPKWAQEHEVNAEDEKDNVEVFLPPIHYPRTVQVKLNDVVSMEEYKLFLRRTAAKEKLQNVALLCAGRGDKLLTTML